MFQLQPPACGARSLAARIVEHLGDGVAGIGSQFRETPDDLCKTRYVDGGRAAVTIEERCAFEGRSMSFASDHPTGANARAVSRSSSTKTPPSSCRKTGTNCDAVRFLGRRCAVVASVRRSSSVSLSGCSWVGREQLYQPVLHPLHAFLLGGAVCFLVRGLLSEGTYYASSEIQWKNLASRLIIGGLMFASFALLWALIGLIGPDRGHRRSIFYCLLLSRASSGCAQFRRKHHG